PRNLSLLIASFKTSADFLVRDGYDLNGYRDECIREHEVPDDLVSKYIRWEYPNDTTTQCHIMCVVSKWELFDVQKGFNLENIHYQLVGFESAHDDEFHHGLSLCLDKNEQGSTACEWAYRGFICLLKQNVDKIQKILTPK
ncbi:hypothetical protein KR018_011884, partial [Drosophila ironensis]